MARQPDKERLARQRERQKELRRQNLVSRRPDRDDIARIVLFGTIRDIAKADKPDVLDDFCDRTVRLLVEQGFDAKACEDLLDELVAQYRTGASPFRRKTHLLFPDGPPVTGNEEDD